MSIRDVSCLRVGIFRAAPFSWFCSTACLHVHLPACLPCFAGSFSLRWQFTSGAAWWWHCGHLPPEPKECHHQLASRAALLSPLLMDLRHAGVSCHLSTLTLNECRNMKSVARHYALLLNHKLGKISEWLKQYRPASSAPVWTWKWMCAAQLSPLHSRQPNSGVETLSQVKVHGGFCSHWQPPRLCQFITGACIPLQSKTNNHRVIIYLRPLPTTVEQRPPMCQ